MTSRAKELQKQHPSADLKLEQKWWVPSVDFGIYMQDALPEDLRAKFNAIFAKLMQNKFAPEAVAEARQQSRELLQAEYPEALERVEETVFKHETRFAAVHCHLQAVGPVACSGGDAERKEL
ncbi:hypothetical protein N657DRAFT_648996 [Parathielavia appendiculata]|uniref:Uncharacterized protein n=1 Tax=Parathielavia appendiculata TaxID=2587402 RepID=A0AAN6TTR5_9PEZI|nr:hypothetical protein N657DRAFT_648996 [Parathielavia appendiculata]